MNFIAGCKRKKARVGGHKRQNPCLADGEVDERKIKERSAKGAKRKSPCPDFIGVDMKLIKTERATAFPTCQTDVRRAGARK